MRKERCLGTFTHATHTARGPHRHKKWILPGENSYQPTGESGIFPQALEGEERTMHFSFLLPLKTSDL